MHSQERGEDPDPSGAADDRPAAPALRGGCPFLVLPCVGFACLLSYVPGCSVSLTEGGCPPFRFHDRSCCAFRACANCTTSTCGSSAATRSSVRARGFPFSGQQLVCSCLPLPVLCTWPSPVACSLAGSGSCLRCVPLHLILVRRNSLVCSALCAASLHVLVDCGPAEFMKISDHMKLVLHKHGIHSTTLQPEFIESGSVRFVVCVRCTCYQLCLGLP